MKKKICVASLLVLLFFAMGVSLAYAYYTKTVIGFYRLDFVSGIATQGTSLIGNAGIGYTSYASMANSSVNGFKNELASKEVVLVHSHGGEGLLTLSSNISLTGNNVMSWSNGSVSCRLLYLSSCLTGVVSSSNGDLPSMLRNKGVGTVVSFRDTIASSTETDGIHRFNRLAISNMVNGYPVAQALSLAWVTFRSEIPEGRNYGANSYRITGNGEYYVRHV